MKLSAYSAVRALVIVSIAVIIISAVIYVNKKSQAAQESVPVSAEEIPEADSSEASAETEEIPAATSKASSPYESFFSDENRKWYVSDASGGFTKDHWDITGNGNLLTAMLTGYDADGNPVTVAGPGVCDITKDISQNEAGTELLKFDAGSGNYYTFELTGSSAMTVYWPDGNIQNCALISGQ